MLDKVILNYFVPFTNGKFVANCLMLSPDVAGKPNELVDTANWVNNEYSDIDYWWQDYEHDWFNTENWTDYLTEQATTNLYKFYTCHEDYAVAHIQRLVPNSRVISIIPDLDLCKRNYDKKNWIQQESEFETSRVYIEFHNFKPMDDLTIHQRDLFDEDKFIKSIEYLVAGLNITIDMERVVAYRNKYFAHPMNQI